MTFSRTISHSALVALTLLLFGYSSVGAEMDGESFAEQKFTREQMMVLNLKNGGRGCSMFYLIESRKAAGKTAADLDHAARQIEQIDAQYAKAKGHPDDRYMDSTVQKIRQAQKTAQLLEEQCRESYVDLKGTITQALIVP